MLTQLLAFLNYYPNFLRQIPSWGWALFACLCLWQAVISWAIYRRAGLRNYVFGAVGLALMGLGAVGARFAENLLQLVMFPGPLLAAGFAVLSLSDARSWYSEEAADKYYLLRHGGLALRLTGRLPCGYVPRRDSPGATWLQGMLVGSGTLALVIFAFFGAREAYWREAIGPRALLWILVALSMLGFHAMALAFFGLLYGAPLRAGSGRAEPDS